MARVPHPGFERPIGHPRLLLPSRLLRAGWRLRFALGVIALPDEGQKIGFDEGGKVTLSAKGIRGGHGEQNIPMRNQRRIRRGVLLQTRDYPVEAMRGQGVPEYMASCIGIGANGLKDLKHQRRGNVRSPLLNGSQRGCQVAMSKQIPDGSWPVVIFLLVSDVRYPAPISCAQRFADVVNWHATVDSSAVGARPPPPRHQCRVTHDSPQHLFDPFERPGHLHAPIEERSQEHGVSCGIPQQPIQHLQGKPCFPEELADKPIHPLVRSDPCHEA